MSDEAKDAARYRWLRDRINWRDVETTDASLSWRERRWTHVDYRENPPPSETLDEYIDAEMRA